MNLLVHRNRRRVADLLQFQLGAQVAGNAALGVHEPEILVALPSVCPLLAFRQVIVTDGQRCAQLNERCCELCSIRRHLDRLFSCQTLQSTRTAGRGLRGDACLTEGAAYLATLPVQLR